jgi:hypothetical protein
MDLSSDEQVKFLVGAAQLNIRGKRDRVLGLRQGIEQFVEANGLSRTITGLEIIPFEHTGHGRGPGELKDLTKCHRP